MTAAHPNQQTNRPRNQRLRAPRRPKHDGHGLVSSDVLFMVKTGNTSMWKRILIHLTTSLSPDRIPPANTVVYSDYPDLIGKFVSFTRWQTSRKSPRALPDVDVTMCTGSSPSMGVTMFTWRRRESTATAMARRVGGPLTSTSSFL